MALPLQTVQLARLLCGIVIALVTQTTPGHAQAVVDWLKTGGTSQGVDDPRKLVRGPNAQFYVSGIFGGPDRSAPEAVLFILDSAGNEIARHPWRGAYADAVAVASNGDYYLSGYVQDPDLLGVGQKYDFYLAKHAADGTLLWERTGGTSRTTGRTYWTDGQDGNALLLDAQGNLLVVGTSKGAAVYGTTAFTNNFGGPLLCKYTPDGTLLWARRVEGSDYSVIVPSTIMLDTGGNLIVGGTMSDGTADFGGIVATINGYWDYGPFTAKFTAAGDVVWVNTSGKAGALDSQGNIYATDHHLDATMVCDLYKLDSSGKTLWQRTIPGVTLDQLAVDGRDEPIYGGSFTGSVQLDDYQLQNDSLVLSAGLVAKADATGRFQWVVTGSSRNLWNAVAGLLREPSGDIYACGSVSCEWWQSGVTSCDSMSVFGSLPLSIEQGGNGDFFLARISDSAPTAVELMIATTPSGLALSWPIEATNFGLEATTSLPAVSWTTVTNTPLVTATNRSVQLPLTGPAQFFRLRQP